MPTLAELKAENAAEEAAALAAEKADEEPKDPPEDKTDPPADTPDEGETTDPPADTVEGGEAAAAVEDDKSWMKADDEKEPDVVHTAFDAKAIREKWKGRATAAETEAETLRKENEELKQRLKAPVITQAPIQGEPKREEFKTDAEYTRALTLYTVNLATQQSQSQQAAAEQRRRQEEAQSRTAQAVDGHYERAVKLAEKSGIKPEAYQSADLRVRHAIEEIFPKAGDAITDSLIASLGAGSEKVFYHLGVNAKRHAEFIQTLKDDRSGIRAATYLGKLNAELNIPAKRETKAPDPPDDVRGDKAGSKTGGDKLKKEYDEAHRKGDAQAAFNIKRKAKNLKVDTGKW